MTLIEKIQRLKSRKGFTLVEVLVSMAITGLLIIAVFALMSPLRDVIKLVNGDADAQMVINSTQMYIINHLQTAKPIIVYEDVNLAATDPNSIAEKIATLLGSSYGNANKDPRVMIIREEPAPDDQDRLVYVYDIAIKSLSACDVATVRTAISPSGDLEKYRLFNRSFYGGAKLEFDIVPPNPSAPYSVKYDVVDDAGAATVLTAAVATISGINVNIAAGSSDGTIASLTEAEKDALIVFDTASPYVAAAGENIIFHSLPPSVATGMTMQINARRYDKQTAAWGDVEIASHESFINSINTTPALGLPAATPAVAGGSDNAFYVIIYDTEKYYM